MVLFKTKMQFFKNYKQYGLDCNRPILASIIAIFSTNIYIFMLARLLQGLSAASALSLWQLFTFIYFEQKAKHIMNTGFMIIGSMPALAPLVGGVLTSYTSWRGIFVFLTILAIVMFF
jgi:MFS family permease